MDLQFQNARGKTLDVKELLVNGVPASGGAGATLAYDYSTALTAPPTSNQIRFNAAHPYTAVTKVWLTTRTTNGVDAYWTLMLVKSGTAVVVQDKGDHTLFGRFTVTGAPIDQGTYVEVPVSWVANGAALFNNQGVLVARS